MLRTLSIRDFVTVEQLELDFQAGFTALTGETGAGKSILFDALGLLLGDRAETHQIRSGTAKAEISAEFVLPADHAQDLNTWLDEAGFDALAGDEPGLLIRRNIESTGRSRAWINGQSATLTQLKQLGEQLVNIHGQHAHQSLSDASSQLGMLDRQAGLGSQVKSLREAHRHWQAALQALDRARQQDQSLAQQKEALAWQIETLEALRLTEGEWEELSQEQQRLAHGAELLEASTTTRQLIDESDEAMTSLLRRQLSRLESLISKDARLADAVTCLQTAEIALSDASRELSRYIDRSDLDPERLTQIESRLSEIFDAARKLKVRPEDLFEELTKAQTALDALMQSSDLAALQKAADQAQAHYQDLAEPISKARQAAAQSLGQAVTGWLTELAMVGAQFTVLINSRSTPAAHGLEDVVFGLAHSAQSPSQPLAKIASGGELSRVSLALAVVAAQATQTPTLLFDEVDAGIGGNTGHVIGRLLRTLGETHQVMVVTHLPQVAARAHQQLRVQKSINEQGQPTSQVQVLSSDQREEEIARMLGDEGLANPSRELAKDLLKLA
jgi:DNA repair protein RecN (Recombination protein N)